MSIIYNVIPALIPGLIFICGLLIGSFLNVCIYRIPIGKTIVKGRSYCPSCNSLIPWFCNIPLFSYIFLKGRCKDCGEKISVVYPVVELMNALLYLLIWQVYGLTVTAVLAGVFFSILLVISFIDLRHWIIPDGLLLAILALGIINAVYQTLVLGGNWYDWAIGFFAASVPLLILGLAYKDGMGGGDIKLMAVAGFFMGWKLILLSLFIGAVYGGVASIFIILIKKGSMKTAVPFGPFLSLGMATGLLAGNQLITWYLLLF